MNILRRRAALSVGAVLVAAWCGCGRDVRLAGAKVRHVQVKPVTHYGITLDESALPRQVAYVALRAIREDVFAATPKERERALDIEFDIAAAGVMEARNKTSLSRDEYIHHVVTHWAPAVSHYAAGFEVDREKAESRLQSRQEVRSSGGDVLETEVVMEAADPSGDPSAAVVLVIWLAKDGGLWRVTHLGFEPKRALTGAQAPPARPGHDS